MRPVLMDGNWVDRLPWVMLGLRLAPKEDMSPSLESASPCSFPATRHFSPESGFTRLPVHHCFPRSFMPTDFAGAPFVFMHHDAHRLSLKPPYNNLFRVPEAGDKSFMLDVGVRSV